MRVTPLIAADASTVTDWLSDTELIRRTVCEPPCLERPWYPFLIRLSDGTPVGWVELFNVDLMNRKAEVGS